VSRIVLRIENLSVSVQENFQRKLIVDKLSLEIKEESITALVGGSGSGKTTTGLAIMRLLAPALSVEEGRIIFNRENIMDFSAQRMQGLRGKDIGMVFQEPLYAFNPVFQIGFQIGEVLQFHTDLNDAQRQGRVQELLDLVGIPDPQRVAKNYPHQLSGGMRQRAMIAQAIAAEPKLIIADEPTSNMDVTLQARIMDLFRELRDRLSLSILLITHDLGMVSHLSDDIAVMTQGRIVECGATSEVTGNPQHKYTKQMMEVFMV